MFLLDRAMGTLATLKRLTADYTNDSHQGNYRHYADDPVGFIQDVLGDTLTPEQIEIAESVRDRSVTLVQAAHGVGKSHIAARIALWFTYAVEGVCISTAPTARQVNQLLWKEIRRAKSGASLPGRIGRDPWLDYIDDRAFARGFTAKDNDSNAFQGTHEKHLLVVIDEACGISNEIWEGAESCLSGVENRMLAIGNPIISDVPFEQACSIEHPILIPVWSHPNVSYAYDLHDDGIHRLKPEYHEPDNRRPELIPGAVSIEWIERARRKGEQSPYWQSRVEARFPGQSGFSIIPVSMFREARDRYDANPELWDSLAETWYEAVGADVGDGGDDHGRAVWRGPVLYSVETIPTIGDRRDTTRLAELLNREHDDPNTTFGVDATGVGAGTASTLLDWNRNAIGIRWGMPASNAEDYQDLKTEQFFNLFEDWDNIAIAPLGEYEEMAKEDLAKTYYEESKARKGTLRMEDKAKTRKRLGRSPNIGDAIVLGYAVRTRKPVATRHKLPTRASYGVKY